jgi:hypothetical protein
MCEPSSRHPQVAASQSARLAADRVWEERHPEPRPDPGVFERDILPRINGISLARLAEVTGLSLQHCGKVRRGLYVPHRRHWEALREIVV